MADKASVLAALDAAKVEVSAIGATPPPPSPTIANFTATPPSIIPGQSSSLNATVSNFMSLAIDGVAIPSLPQVVAPLTTRTYTLTATGAAGTVPATAQTTVVVNIPVQSSLVRQTVNLQRVVALDRQLMSGSRYERYQKHTSLNQTVNVLKINCDDQTQGGLPVAFAYPKYGLQFAPLMPDNSVGSFIERGTVTVQPGTTKTANLTATLGNEPDGWYLTRLVAYDAAGNVVTSPTEWEGQYWLVIDRNGTARNDTRVVIQSGNFDWQHTFAGTNLGYFTWIVLPKSAVVPQARPLPARNSVTPFSTTLGGGSLARVSLLPTTDTIDQNTHYPCVTNRGVTVCDNMQGYEPFHMFALFPTLPLMDGERGICTAPHALFLRGGRNGKVYGMTPWSFFVMDSTGKKTTLAGLVHNEPTYWESPVSSVSDPRIRVVGNWVGVPPAEQYPRESWGMDWDAQSLLLDNNAAPIGGEQPHLPYTTSAGQLVDGPRYFFVDVLNRCVEGQTNGRDRAAPHRMMVRISGLSDPWGCVSRGRSIFIAERGRHAISEWSMDTYQKVRDVIIDPTASSLGAVGTNPRRWQWFGGYPAGRDACRLRPIVAPEGLAIIDDWLYWGSMAQAQVKRVNLTTGIIENVCNVPLSVGGGVDSYYVQIAVSDGTFGPKGSVFTTTFYNDNLGKPNAFQPNGTGWGYQNYQQGIDCGAGGNWNGSHYATGVAVHEGRMFCADSSGAINYFCKADSYDKPIDAVKAKAGWSKWQGLGYSVMHGPYAINRSTAPLPWGIDANIDYWMTNVLRLQ